MPPKKATKAKPITKEKDTHRFDVVNLDPPKDKDKDIVEKEVDPLCLKQPIPGGILLSGQTGSGKTNALVNMLMNDFLKYDKLYIYTSHPKQDKYVQMGDFFHALEEDPNFSDKIDKPIMTIKKGLGDLPAPEELDKKYKSIVVFDDLLMEPKKSQDRMQEYFISARHSNCTPIYLTQSYFDTPKVIRKQAGALIFFEAPNNVELSEFARRHANEMTKEEFKAIFKEATAEPHNFFMIAKTAPKHLKYRRNFTDIIDPEFFIEDTES